MPDSYVHLMQIFVHFDAVILATLKLRLLLLLKHPPYDLQQFAYIRIRVILHDATSEYSTRS